MIDCSLIEAALNRVEGARRSLRSHPDDAAAALSLLDVAKKDLEAALSGGLTADVLSISVDAEG